MCSPSSCSPLFRGSFAGMLNDDAKIGKAPYFILHLNSVVFSQFYAILFHSLACKCVFCLNSFGVTETSRSFCLFYGNSLLSPRMFALALFFSGLLYRLRYGRISAQNDRSSPCCLTSYSIVCLSGRDRACGCDMRLSVAPAFSVCARPPDPKRSSFTLCRVRICLSFSWPPLLFVS